MVLDHRRPIERGSRATQFCFVERPPRHGRQPVGRLARTPKEDSLARRLRRRTRGGERRRRRRHVPSGHFSLALARRLGKV